MRFPTNVGVLRDAKGQEEVVDCSREEEVRSSLAPVAKAHSSSLVRIKAERDELEKPYLFATIDGRKEKVGNFRVEPPGLFRGRGEHPKKGRFKVRAYV